MYKKLYEGQNNFKLNDDIISDSSLNSFLGQVPFYESFIDISSNNVLYDISSNNVLYDISGIMQTIINNSTTNYNNKNISSSFNDTIDNDGNLLINNPEISLSLRDALSEDTINLLLKQNDMYIVGLIILTAILISIVVLLFP